jgi:hypothetical protein
VCRVCLDQADDGSCGLRGRVCAVVQHLPRLAEVLSAVHSTRVDDYVTAVETEVCTRCRQDAIGCCRLRNAGECALAAYLPLVVDAFDEASASLAVA